MFKKTRTPGQNPDNEGHLKTHPEGESNPLSRRFQLGDDTPTVKLNQPQDPVPRPSVSEESETRIFTHTSDGTNEAPNDRMSDPPVGILVIVEGPGKGNVVTFGYGMNSIGRGETERVSLDFGDQRISRQKHALITYDGNSRKFFVQHGGGANLTYLGDSPVLIPQAINERDLIKLGDTVLMFLPLCNADFDWQSTAGN